MSEALQIISEVRPCQTRACKINKEALEGWRSDLRKITKIYKSLGKSKEFYLGNYKEIIKKLER